MNLYLTTAGSLLVVGTNKLTAILPSCSSLFLEDQLLLQGSCSYILNPKLKYIGPRIALLI